MPSEDSLDAAFRAVAVRGGAFSSAVAVTADQLNSRLEAARRAANGASGTAASLGPFAAGRIDPERFAALSARDRTPGQGWSDAAAAALRALTALRDRADAVFRLQLPTGADLLSAVEEALAEAGRAFAAARLVAQSPQLSSQDGDSPEVPGRFPFRFWSQAERQLAPPLVIELRGEDLSAAGLAGYLDGAACLVLVVDGSSPPAPLVRLISPGVFVRQTSDANRLEIPQGWRGPAIMALLPEGAAEFTHLPSGNGLSGLEIDSLPDPPSARTGGRLSVSQRTEELLFLRAIAAGDRGTAEVPLQDVNASVAEAEPSREAGIADPGQGVDPVEALASWLLAQADLEGI